MFGFDTAKLVMIGGALLLLSVLAYKAHDSIGDAREAKIVAKYEAQIAKQNAAARASEQAQRDTLHARSESYEKQIAELRRDATPVPIIRVRQCPRPVNVPSTTAATGEPREASADGLGNTDGQSGAEIQFSNGLRAYAIDAQACAIQLTEVIQSWAK